MILKALDLRYLSSKLAAELIALLSVCERRHRADELTMRFRT